MIDCTGNACKGDYVEFERAVFIGSYPRAKFLENEIVTGLIISDSYGKGKQQHTFTIQLDDGTKTRIKGRNLYRNGCMRKEWDNEEERQTILNEKYGRGNKARSQRHERKQEVNDTCAYCGCNNGQHYNGCAINI